MFCYLVNVVMYFEFNWLRRLFTCLYLPETSQREKERIDGGGDGEGYRRKCDMNRETMWRGNFKHATFLHNMEIFIYTRNRDEYFDNKLYVHARAQSFDRGI